MGVLSILELLLPFLKDRGLKLAEQLTPSYFEDKWRKAQARIVKRLTDEAVGLDYTTEVRPSPPAAYVGFAIYRLWASVLRGGIIVDGFRDATTPKVLAAVQGQLDPNDHGHNVRLITTELHRLVF